MSGWSDTVIGTHSLRTPYSYSLYRHQEHGLPSERYPKALATLGCNGCRSGEKKFPLFYMCTTLLYDSYNKFITPVFARSLLCPPFVSLGPLAGVLSNLGTLDLIYFLTSPPDSGPGLVY